MPLTTEMQTLTASDGLKLAYAVDDFSDPWRPQETLILIHTAMGSSRHLYKWIPTRSRHYRVVRPDMRGHGQSGMPSPDQLSLQRTYRISASSTGSSRSRPKRTLSYLPSSDR